MNLPYDTARCHGTEHEVCQSCRRREPGHPEWQTYIAPPFDTWETGLCDYRIEPAPPKKSKRTS